MNMVNFKLNINIIKVYEINAIFNRNTNFNIKLYLLKSASILQILLA
jgi:hypothetical protein